MGKIPLKARPEVEIRGTGKGLVILLDSQVPAEQLARALQAKLSAAPGFFAGAVCELRWRDRAQEPDLPVLKQLLAQHGITIRHRSDDGALALPSDHAGGARVITLPQHQTLLVQGLVRSGQTVRYPGHVVIAGHVNPGGRVEAGGHVAVLGKLAGTVLAGWPDNRGARIWAWWLHSTQVAVAGHYLPPGVPPTSGPKMIRLHRERLRVEDWLSNRSMPI
ncbi:MAG: septum site-determining protein MinC [Moorellales bacterium]